MIARPKKVSLTSQDWDISPYVMLLIQVRKYLPVYRLILVSTGYTSLWNTLGTLVENTYANPITKSEVVLHVNERIWDISEKDLKKIKD